MNTLDDLELELRKLPGVKAAGFDEREDVLLVQLHVGDKIDSPEHPVPIEASRIVARHVEERTAVEIVLHRSSGHHSLDRAALAAVRTWHFLPAMRDGRPVPSWVEIPVRFHLR